MYSMMLSVPGSMATKSRISPKSTSAPMPVEIRLEKPTSLFSAQSRIAVHSAPDCEMTAIRPGSALPALNVAFSPMSVRITPRQLGPRIRKP